MNNNSHLSISGNGHAQLALPAPTSHKPSLLVGPNGSPSRPQHGQTATDQSTGSQCEPGPDYPTPPAIDSDDLFTWATELAPVDNYAAFGRRLAACGDLYRNPDYAGGLLLASGDPRVPPLPILDAATLGPVVTDRIRLRVTKEGKIKGGMIPSNDLKIMLRAEAFLQQFRPIDAVEHRSRYLEDLSTTRPGYNDGGPGQRILLVGGEPWIESGHEAIDRFLDVMAFASEADRTNAVAAALTALLRHSWPGGKPCLIITSSKSHGGKETIVTYAAGATPHVSISYEDTDWALQKAFVATVKDDRGLGLINVENARLERGVSEIRSAFLERFLTDPEPMLYSPGTGDPVRRRNDLVIAITTNHANVSEDLMNRALRVHLDPLGDIATRTSPIGNPKLEYLPAHRDRIEAELRGMIEKWKAAGRPLDESVSHPFGPWAQTIGGILMVNGYSGFLGNLAVRKTADDPVRRALGLLGAAKPDAWLRTADWAALAASQGLVKALIAPADRDSDLGRERGMGEVLSRHRDESFHVEGEDQRLVLKLEKACRRFMPGGEPQTRYRFVLLDAQAIPEDPAP